MKCKNKALLSYAQLTRKKENVILYNMVDNMDDIYEKYGYYKMQYIMERK